MILFNVWFVQIISKLRGLKVLKAKALVIELHPWRQLLGKTGSQVVGQVVSELIGDRFVLNFLGHVLNLNWVLLRHVQCFLSRTLNFIHYFSLIVFELRVVQHRFMQAAFSASLRVFDVFAEWSHFLECISHATSSECLASASAWIEKGALQHWRPGFFKFIKSDEAYIHIDFLDEIFALYHQTVLEAGSLLILNVFGQFGCTQCYLHLLGLKRLQHKGRWFNLQLVCAILSDFKFNSWAHVVFEKQLCAVRSRRELELLLWI